MKYIMILLILCSIVFSSIQWDVCSDFSGGCASEYDGAVTIINSTTVRYVVGEANLSSYNGTLYPQSFDKLKIFLDSTSQELEIDTITYNSWCDNNPGMCILTSWPYACDTVWFHLVDPLPLDIEIIVILGRVGNTIGVIMGSPDTTTLSGTTGIKVSPVLRLTPAAQPNPNVYNMRGRIVGRTNQNWKARVPNGIYIANRKKILICK